MSSPAPGTLVLYDDVVPPLPAGSYRATARTTVHVRGADQSLASVRHFDVESPRFGLSPSEIVSFYPPRNGHGSFHETLPQIVLRRRTLPWERPLDPGGRIPAPKRAPGEAGPRGQTPWMALLLLDDGEGQLLESVRLEDVVPADVFQRLGSPAGITCDALEIERAVLRGLLPSLDEVRLLAHAREASADAHALDVGDGFVSVVMANRLPAAGARHRACLVSLEERSDLVAADPPAVASDDLRADFGDLVAVASIGTFSPVGIRVRDANVFHFPLEPAGPARLVMLASWTFEDGDATFPELMRGLDVGMFGDPPATSEAAPITDTGHLPLSLEDRDGVTQTVWYRSPLAAVELARDDAGPYHSADQARRVSPETGAEDVTYAAAFEIGRLLCAADARAVADLARWRRLGHRETSRARTLARAAAALPMDFTAEELASAPAPVLAVAALERTASAAIPRADTAGLAGVRAAGLDAAAVADAWALGSVAAANVILAPRPLTIATAAVTVTGAGPIVAAPAPSLAATPARARDAAARRPDPDSLADGLERLVEARDALVTPPTPPTSPPPRRRR